MLISTIIPTIGRPSLSKAVNSVLDQNFPSQDCEIIVVNDSGNQLIQSDWQQSERVKIIHTNRRNRSAARNTGAAVAKGKYLHFLDDDDWMFPDAFQLLAELVESTNAAWFFGGFRLVDNAGTKITDLFPSETGNCAIQLMAWEWIPLQASWIASDAFFRVGGFSSLSSLLGGFEDVDLSRKISLTNNMARTNKLVTAIRAGDVGSTTNYVDMFKQNRQSREKMLEKPGAFSRLRNSAKSSSKPNYWLGKVIYYYLASMKWNIRRRHVMSASSRYLHSIYALMMSANRIFSTEFWRGVIKPHYPRMGIALEEVNANHLYAETRRKIDMD